jgi:GAF domain-containing protein
MAGMAENIAHAVVREASERALRMLGEGATQREILPVLVRAAERATGGDAVSSILLVDKEGLLRNGASPGLPEDYLKAIDRLKPDPMVGTCAAAAATGSIVLTPDFRADEKWAELRHLPLALGFQGAWSHPIKDPTGKVIGTFGTYFREQRAPTETEQRAVAALVDTAAQVIAQTRCSQD